MQTGGVQVFYGVSAISRRCFGEGVTRTCTVTIRLPYGYHTVTIWCMYGSVRCMCEHCMDPYVLENTGRILRSLYVACTGPGDCRECTYRFLTLYDCLRAFYGGKKDVHAQLSDGMPYWNLALTVPVNYPVCSMWPRHYMRQNQIHFRCKFLRGLLHNFFILHFSVDIRVYSSTHGTRSYISSKLCKFIVSHTSWSGDQLMVQVHLSSMWVFKMTTSRCTGLTHQWVYWPHTSVGVLASHISGCTGLTHQWVYWPHTSVGVLASHISGCTGLTHQWYIYWHQVLIYKGEQHVVLSIRIGLAHYVF